MIKIVLMIMSSACGRMSSQENAGESLSKDSAVEISVHGDGYRSGWSWGLGKRLLNFQIELSWRKMLEALAQFPIKGLMAAEIWAVSLGIS